MWRHSGVWYSKREGLIILLSKAKKWFPIEIEKDGKWRLLIRKEMSLLTYAHIYIKNEVKLFEAIKIENQKTLKILKSCTKMD